MIILISTLIMYFRNKAKKGAQGTKQMVKDFPYRSLVQRYKMFYIKTQD